jgi:cyclic beta-1,2-glucan synthetase
MTEFIQIADQQNPEAAPLSVAYLRQHAQATARKWGVIRRPQKRSRFLLQIKGAGKSLDQLYAKIDSLSRGNEPKIVSGSPLLELRENSRMLRAVVIEATSLKRSVNQFPRIIIPGGDASDGPKDQTGGLPRVAAVAEAFLDATNFVWNSEAFEIYVHQIQQDDALNLDELWALPLFVKFHIYEQIVAGAQALLGKQGNHKEALEAPLAVCVKALRDVGYANWAPLIESLIQFDNTLQQDPAQSYKHMDFDTRELYRKRVAEYSHQSEFSELQVAAAALALAKEAQEFPVVDQRVHLRKSHIGYYLIDKGFPALAALIGYHPTALDRLRSIVRQYPDEFYLGGIEIITFLLMAAVIMPLAAKYTVIGGLTLGFFLLLLPAAQGTVDLFNNIVTSLFRAQMLPKLDFSNCIPAEFATLVAVPTLLMNERQVTELVEDLEVRFLANPDPNLHFALLTDLPDSITRPREKDSDPLVILARRLINDLNVRYRGEHYGSFFLLHRHRIYNARQGVWMGWERKRGKLLDLNRYLQGGFDAFPVKVGDLDVLSHVRYIVTLDSDTQLPHGTAARLVGAIAHPLNRAVIDPKLHIVTEGYGILQPRVGVSVSSAARSRLASIYSGQTGFDIYARAVSDAYQDLYGEGIFTGKGVYEVATFHEVLDHRFPHNSLLSHDLIEGSYARVGLATDIEIIDDYPSHYSAYTRRKHRWVRGDWQIAQWMFPRVPDESRHYVANPVSTISRWRILDNLRRSLSEPFTFLLLVAGWLGLPGGPLYWTIATLLLLFLPNLVQLVFSLGNAALADQKGAVSEALSGFFQAVGVTLLTLAFLPHQTLLALDAIIRSIVRRFITGQRLLEWETAAEAEGSIRSKKRAPVDTYLAVMPLIALALAAIIWLFNWGALHIALPLLALWGFSGFITAWLNAPPQDQHASIGPDDEVFLRQQALRIWRFYAEFGGEKHNYLIPDHVEEAGYFEAPRVSTTNIGMLLNARQAAVEFGFITLPEFVDLTTRTLATIEKLEKLHGHPFNWYDTLTLAPLSPVTISSVDNGNLAASFYTLRAGAQALIKLPLFKMDLFTGLHTCWQLGLLQEKVPKELNSYSLPPIGTTAEEWISWTFASEQIVQSAITAASPTKAAWWLCETQQRILLINKLVREYFPWMLPEFTSLRTLNQLNLARIADLSLAAAPDFTSHLQSQLTEIATSHPGGVDASLLERLFLLLPDAIERQKALGSSVQIIADTAFRFVEQMDFGVLLEKGRQLLSIGYEVATKKLYAATYDMLASEARIATFLAIAKGDIPQQSWFKLSRTHTIAFNKAILLSWTGTMFEYLMPSLWMRSYPDTLIAPTLDAAVEIQRVYARKLNIPWGISESGYALQDAGGHYQYQAFGIPDTALKWNVTAGPVVSPYSSFLALGIDAPIALRNLRHMSELGWSGVYGLYESVDYTQSRLQPECVREWMAHHLGMSLLAILNLLHENIVQSWFHSNPQLQAAELLLHERPIRKATIRTEYKQFASK